MAIAATTLAATAQKSIIQRQYWLDGKISERQAIADASFSVDISSLNPRVVHSLALHVQDSEGVWSSPVSRFFIVPESSDDVTIDCCSYWFDGVPYTAVVKEISPSGAGSTQTGLVEVDVGDLTKGEHTINWQVRDSRGVWSDVYTDTFTTIEYLVGDVTGDNKVDVEDVNAIINIILELKSKSDYPGNADITGDGKVDVEDVNAAINIILAL